MQIKQFLFFGLCVASLLGTSCNENASQQVKITAVEPDRLIERQTLKNQTPNGSVDFKGEIVAYEKSAMTDSFESGEFMVFDSCEIKILDTSPNQDISLIKVYVRQVTAGPGPYLDEVGRLLKFSIESDLLSPGTKLFQGSLDHLEFVD